MRALAFYNEERRREADREIGRIRREILENNHARADWAGWLRQQRWG